MNIGQWFICAALLVVAVDTALHSGDYGNAGMPKEFHKHDGKFQSPIDLRNAYEVDLRDIQFNYPTTQFKIVNTGYFIKLKPLDTQNYIIVDGKQHPLVEFHFHTPSEHMIEGKQYPMEAHFVHKTKEGDVAVVGVIFEAGAHNDALDAIITNLPSDKKVEHTMSTSLDLKKLFPQDKRYFRYTGSLTTPHFGEGVKWFVIKQPVQVDAEQLRRMTVVMGKNSRPVQQLQNRPIVFDSAIDKDCVMDIA